MYCYILYIDQWRFRYTHVSRTSRKVFPSPGYPGQKCSLLWFRQPDTLLLRIDDDVGPVTLRSPTRNSWYVGIPHWVTRVPHVRLWHNHTTVVWSIHHTYHTCGEGKKLSLFVPLSPLSSTSFPRPKLLFFHQKKETTVFFQFCFFIKKRTIVFSSKKRGNEEILSHQVWGPMISYK